MTAPVLEARGIVKAFAVHGRRRTILPGVSLGLGQGGILALLGPSGCGKSTLLDILAGFAAPDAGQVLLDGKPARAPGPQRAVAFQEDALFPWLTVLENVTLGLRAAGMGRAASREPAQAMLARVGLAGFERHLPGTLSGGMRQRLALARVLVLEPRVLLMDEPFAALDAITRERMRDLLVSLHQSMPMSILLVTHDVAEAVQLADDIVVLGPAGQGVAGRFAVARPRPRSETDRACLPVRQEVRELLRREAAEGH